MENHKINNLELLNNTISELETICIEGKIGDMSIDSISSNLNEAINILKESWNGEDATSHIQTLTNNYNALLGLRTRLTQIVDNISSTAVAYRDRQIANGGNAESLQKVTVTETIGNMESYSGMKNIVHYDVNGVNNAISKIQNAVSSIETLRGKLISFSPIIFDNWLQGGGRNLREEEFSGFIAGLDRYIKELSAEETYLLNSVKTY